jgi:hypothetical protein
MKIHQSSAPSLNVPHYTIFTLEPEEPLDLLANLTIG